MAMEIFKLVGSVFVDTDEATNSLKKLDDTGTNTGQVLSTAFKGIASAAAAVTTAAVSAGKAIYDSAMDSAATADNIDKMSQKLGISREAYQELDYITSQNGMSVDTLQTGMKKLTSTLADAQTARTNWIEGEKEAYELLQAGEITQDEYNKTIDKLYASLESGTEDFAALGWELSDLADLSAEDAFYKVIESLQDMEDETQRNALASELFGKSATEMLPLLNSGSASMEELRQKAHDLGLVLDDEVIDDGVELTDTMDSLKRSLSNLGTNLSGTLMPIVTQAAQYLIDHLPQIQSIFDNLAPAVTALAESLLPIFFELADELLPVFGDLLADIMPVITDIIEDVMPILLDVFKELTPILSHLIQTFLPIIASLLSKILPVASQLFEKLLPPLASLLDGVFTALSPLLDLLNPVLDIITTLITPLADLMNYIIGPVVDAITAVVSLLMGDGSEGSGLSGALSWIGELVEGVFGDMVDVVKDKFDWIMDLLNDVITFVSDVFKGDWEAVWDDIGSFFADLWDGIVQTFKDAVGWIEDIWDGIVGFFSGEDDTEVSTASVTGSVRAKGGVLRKGEIGILEGTGAEAVVPLDQNQKWISKVAADMNGALGGAETVSMLQGIQESIAALSKSGIYLDGKKLVGYLGEDIYDDTKDRSIRRARGIA